ncbi:hypothetical protein ACF0H5_002278 [Mactra antiquata]
MDEVTIEELNFEEAKLHVGGVVFVAILMFVGFVGNLHVLIVYTFFMKPSNHRIFILVLGTLDFITCIIGMPFIIVDLRNPLTFTLSSACKILRFINYFICSASALTLIIIATDRYRKICVPFGKQITQRVAAILCCVVLFIALLMAWPAPVLYGIAHVKTEGNLTGTRCWTEDKPNFDKLQGYFNAVLVLIVLVTLTILVVLYSLIGRVISKHTSFRSKDSKSKSALSSAPNSQVTSELSSAATDLSDQKSNSQDKKEQQKTSDEDSTDSSSPCKTTSEKYEMEDHDKRSKSKVEKSTDSQKKEGRPKNFQQAKRTTFMFFLITVMFFLSYIPHLSLKIVVFMNKDFFPNLSFTSKVLYNTFVWCFFVNNVINCFVYGFFDPRFRQSVREMYGKLAFWK